MSLVCVCPSLSLTLLPPKRLTNRPLSECIIHQQHTYQVPVHTVQDAPHRKRKLVQAGFHIRRMGPFHTSFTIYIRLPNFSSLLFNTAVTWYRSDDDVALDLQYYSGFSMPREAPALPTATRPPRPHGGATLSRRSSPPCAGRKNRCHIQTRRAGSAERRPPGDSLLGPPERRGSPAGKGGFL